MSEVKKKGIQKGTTLTEDQKAQRAATRAMNKAAKENETVIEAGKTFSTDDIIKTVDYLTEQISNIELTSNLAPIKVKVSEVLNLIESSIKVKNEVVKKELEEINKVLEAQNKKRKELTKYLNSITE